MKQTTTKWHKLLLEIEMDENQIPQKTKKEWLKQAIDYFNAKHYSKALEACEYAVQLDDTWSRAYHGMGLILTQQGHDYKKALVAYERAIQLCPDNAKIAFDMGELYFLLKDYKKACVYYNKAIQQDNKYKTFYLAKVEKLVNNAWVTQPYSYYEYNDEAVIRVFNNVLLLNPGNKYALSFFTELERRKPKKEPIFYDTSNFYNRGWSLAQSYWEIEGSPYNYSGMLALFNRYAHEIPVAMYMDGCLNDWSKSAFDGFVAYIRSKEKQQGRYTTTN